MENNQQEKLKQQIEMVESTAKNFLDAQALQRFGTLKLAHPEKALHIAAVIAQAAQAGQIKNPLNDQEFKNILMNLQEEKKDFKFTRK